MNPSTDLNELMQACLNGTLDDTQERELARLLQESGEARQALRALLRIEGELLSLAEAKTLGGTRPKSFNQPNNATIAHRHRSSPNNPSRFRNPLRLRIAASVAILATVLLVIVSIHLFSTSSSPRLENGNSPSLPAQGEAERKGEAEISEIAGSVEILSAGQDAKPAGDGSKLILGQTVRTGAEASSAVVVYSDGTRLDLASGTVASFWQTLPTNTAQKRVFLTAGMLSAEMPPSRNESGMIISTPHAEVRLHGAKLALSVDPNSTYVELESGKAELIRNVDGQPIRLTQGSYVVSTNQIEPMLVALLPAARAEPCATWKICGQTLDYAPDNSFLAVPWGERIQICQPETGEILYSLIGHKTEIRQVAITPSGRQLVSGGSDPFLIIWDISKRNEQQRLQVGSAGMRCLALSRDGRMLACVPAHVREQGLLTLWDMATGDEIQKIQDPKGEFMTITFSPSGNLLAIATSDHRIVILDPSTGSVTKTIILGKVSV